MFLKVSSQNEGVLGDPLVQMNLIHTLETHEITFILYQRQACVDVASRVHVHDSYGSIISMFRSAIS